MVEYAAQDVLYLPQIYEVFKLMKSKEKRNKIGSKLNSDLSSQATDSSVRSNGKKDWLNSSYSNSSDQEQNSATAIDTSSNSSLS